MKMTKKTSKKGFTLIELLIVISIIALLSAIILAAVSTARTKGTIAAGLEFAAYNYHAMGDLNVLYWNFNTCPTISDTSGNNYSGAVITGTQGCTNDTPLGSGQAFTFDGATDIGANLSSAPNMNSHTVSVWVKLLNPIGTNMVVLRSLGCSAQGGTIGLNDCALLMLYPSNVIYFGPGYNGSGSFITTTYAIPVKIWTNLTYAYNPCSGNPTEGCYTLYINGTEIISSQPSPSGDIVTGNMNSIIVGSAYSSTNYFSGYIDDLAIYNESLTAGQLSTLYRIGAAEHGLALK